MGAAFTPLLIDATTPCRDAVGVQWFVDETYVRVSRTWRDLYLAVDEPGRVIDIMVSRRRRSTDVFRCGCGRARSINFAPKHDTICSRYECRLRVLGGGAGGSLRR